MSLNKNILLIFFIFIGVSYSQEVDRIKQVENSIKDTLKTKELGAVLVTATRTERQLSSLPLPAQVISKEQILSSNSMRLSDVINEQTGLITVSDVGGGEGLQLQGMDSAYTLVMIDGVPIIGRLGGTLDLNRITVANIKQIEVIKGASSCLYGSEAMGGVLNIITETPNEDFNANLNYRYGSFNTHDTSLNLGYKEDKIAITGSINRYSTNGYDLENVSIAKTLMPFENYTFQTKIKYNFTDKTALTLSSRLFNQYQKVNSVFDENLLLGSGKINEWNSTLKLEHKISKNWDIYGELYATEYQTKSRTNDVDGSIFSQDYFNQILVRPEIRTHFQPNKKHSVIFGSGFTYETLDRTYFNETPKFEAPYIYGQYDINPTKKLNIIVGARYDAHNKYAAQFSPKLAVRYEISNSLSVKSSVGYGYKAPDFRQLFLNFTNPSRGYSVLGHNLVISEISKLDEQGEIVRTTVPIGDYDDDLKAESSVNFNFGIDYKVNNQLKFNINFFRNNISNLIDTQVIAVKSNGQNIFSYYNANKVYTQGIEFNTYYKPIKQLQISGGYQLLYAKDKSVEDMFANGQVYSEDYSSPLKKSQYFGLPNRSRHMANIKFFYKNKDLKFDANIRGNYRSKYGLADTNNSLGYIDNFDEFVNGYSIWNIALNKDIYQKYQIGVGIDNVLDFTDVRSDKTDIIYINNIPGRILYAKFNINF